MEKADVLKYFTIAMIVIFGLEILSTIFLSAPATDNTIPTPLPPAIPTPGAAFSGTGQTQASVLKLIASVAVNCDTKNDSVVVISRLAGAGIANAVYSSATTLIGKADVNRTDLEANATSALSGICTPVLSRFAALEVVSDATFTSDSNQSKLVPKAGLACFASPTQQCFAVVNLDAKEGETVPILVFVNMQGSVIIQAVAEEFHGQPEQPQYEIKRVPANATVVELLTVWAGFSDIPFEKRGFDSSTVARQVNGTAEIIEFDYQQDNTIFINGTGEPELAAISRLA